MKKERRERQTFVVVLISDRVRERCQSGKQRSLRSRTSDVYKYVSVKRVRPNKEKILDKSGII